MEAIRATYYGDYNYNDEYVKFNGYGNIDSYSEYERIEPTPPVIAFDTI